MRDRILEFLKSENKSSAQLAEEIGVQPSGISHILSGRNKPSLDFVLKMLEKYKLLSTEWLLFGKGSMYKGIQMKSLFDNDTGDNTKNESQIPEKEALKSTFRFQDVNKEQEILKTPLSSDNRNTAVEKIVWFYNDNSFEEYFPRS